MKEHPILFSTEMIKAILEGRKTMTRRIMKIQPPVNIESTIYQFATNRTGISDKDYGKHHWLGLSSKNFCSVLDSGQPYFKCPYGKLGDMLWVRESFAVIGNEVVRDESSGAIIEETPQYVFRGEKQPHIERLYKWKPPIYMPKAAARIWLEITGIRVERLQDISEEDAKVEGAMLWMYPNGKNAFGEEDFYSARTCFHSLWKSINGPESWQSNPWVWVVSFRKIEKPNQLAQAIYNG